MMNQLILYLISYILFIPPADEWKEWGLKGKIKSLREYGSNADPREEIIKVPEGANYEWIEFTKDGKIKSHTVITNNGENQTSPLYEYDNNGYRTSLTWFDSDSIFTKYTYVYNANDKIEWYEEGRGYNKQKTQYLYDSEGRMIEETHYNRSGSVDYKLKNEYDQKGNLLSSKQYDSKDQYVSTTTYTYDKYNNPITEAYSSADGFMNGTKTYTYEYDKKGNWIKRVKYDRRDQPFFVKERKIEYY